VGLTTQDGKGVPNGRSDSEMPFIQASMPLSTDSHYGYTVENPIKVGPRTAARVHILYLNSLRGPNGEPIEYERLGSCCKFETKNSAFGAGLLDMYRITFDGTSKELVLYVNMYDPGPPQLPMGFTQRR
jgi:hypothetical protein